jgi:hypothetical protein
MLFAFQSKSGECFFFRLSAPGEERIAGKVHQQLHICTYAVLAQKNSISSTLDSVRHNIQQEQPSNQYQSLFSAEQLPFWSGGRREAKKKNL